MVKMRNAMMTKALMRDSRFRWKIKQHEVSWPGSTLFYFMTYMQMKCMACTCIIKLTSLINLISHYEKLTLKWPVEPGVRVKSNSLRTRFPSARAMTVYHDYEILIRNIDTPTVEQEGGDGTPPRSFWYFAKFWNDFTFSGKSVIFLTRWSIFQGWWGSVKVLRVLPRTTFRIFSPHFFKEQGSTQEAASLQGPTCLRPIANKVIYRFTQG